MNVHALYTLMLLLGLSQAALPKIHLRQPTKDKAISEWIRQQERLPLQYHSELTSDQARKQINESFSTICQLYEACELELAVDHMLFIRPQLGTAGAVLRFEYNLALIYLKRAQIAAASNQPLMKQCLSEAKVYFLRVKEKTLEEIAESEIYNRATYALAYIHAQRDEWFESAQALAGVDGWSWGLKEISSAKLIGIRMQRKSMFPYPKDELMSFGEAISANDID